MLVVGSAQRGVAKIPPSIRGEFPWHFQIKRKRFRNGIKDLNTLSRQRSVSRLLVLPVTLIILVRLFVTRFAETDIASELCDNIFPGIPA
jgi:hypothetical protein